MRVSEGADGFEGDATRFQKRYDNAAHTRGRAAPHAACRQIAVRE